MKQTISSLDARRDLDELIEGVCHKSDEVVIERAGKAVAVVISTDRYEAMERSRERMFSMMDEVHRRNADVPPEVLEAEVAEALDAVRRQSAPTAAR